MSGFAFKAGASRLTLIATVMVALFAGGAGAQTGASTTGASTTGASTAAPTPPDVTYLDQGWTTGDRNAFYTTGQGSQIMPYAWFKALRRWNENLDEAFTGDQLARYGYLANDATAKTTGLPVGFVIDSTAAPPQIGMTCAACHTGQLEYQKDGVTHAIRLDGAPADSDFQQFLTDLGAAASATLAQPDRFAAFAKAVLGTSDNAANATKLQADFAKWTTAFNAFMGSSLPDQPWGPGRLDAFGMIFNRDTGLDLVVPGNIVKADAPVSYPFLWNAHRQQHTQWNGGVPNGLFITAMARNAGEVLGVFAHFQPGVRPPPNAPLKIIDFRTNSIQFDGLQTLEEKIAVLKPPPWPATLFPLDSAKVAAGKTLFDANCGKCHNENPATTPPHAWITPVTQEGTDPKMATNAERLSDPGMYAGSPLPPPEFGQFPSCPLEGKTDQNCVGATSILADSVIGTLLDEFRHPKHLLHNPVLRALGKDLEALAPARKAAILGNPQTASRPDLEALISSQLNRLYQNRTPAAAGAAYEARVLHGIWATAPYLHNGSVPNLWELLTPPTQRKTNFFVGSRMFDAKNVGYATDSSPFKTGAFQVDASNGNSNGGHLWGTALSDDEKWQIVEYLKQF